MTASLIIPPLLVLLLRGASAFHAKGSFGFRLASNPLFMTTSFAPVPRGHAGTKDRAAHVATLDRSLKDLTGRGVYDRMSMDPNSEPCCCEVCLNERYALISHGPRELEEEVATCYNYGNSAMLSLLDCSWYELCGLPARRFSPSGENVMGTELMELGGGCLEGAGGIWVDHNGSPFTVHNMVIWNCYDDDGKYYGQAAMFDRYEVDKEPLTP